jgi:CRISPR-associated protein Cas5d
MNRYPVEFEIEGPAAMFARPDTGAAPISYPVPTWSACKAMFEAVTRGFFSKDSVAAFFSPTNVEIWRPVRFEKYMTNYRGPLRKPGQIKDGTSYQLPATILVDVCYRVKGETVHIPGTENGGVNSTHALQEMFERRLTKGITKYTPCLGWKEFVPTYFGPFRSHSDLDDNPRLQSGAGDVSLPGFLLSVWDSPVNGNYRPEFRELFIKRGILHFPNVRLENGKLVYEEV